MHRKTPISVLVYNEIFPNPRPEDPSTFSAHLSKNLVSEVRVETATFYGSLDTIEARYPGLNYSNPPHRKRLGRFPHHKRLFAAFDKLRLTETEIASLCRWEGTLWARQRYERDEGIKVLDTTGNEIGPWISRDPVNQLPQFGTKTGSGDVDIPNGPLGQSRMELDGDSDDEIESIGIPLNARLIAGAARREQGAPHGSVDADWDKYIEPIELQRHGQINAASNPLGRTMPPPPPPPAPAPA